MYKDDGTALRARLETLEAELEAQRKRRRAAEAERDAVTAERDAVAARNRELELELSRFTDEKPASADKPATSRDRRTPVMIVGLVIGGLLLAGGLLALTCRGERYTDTGHVKQRAILHPPPGDPPADVGAPTK